MDHKRLYSNSDYIVLDMNHSNGKATPKSGKLPTIHAKDRKGWVAGASGPSYLCLTQLSVMVHTLSTQLNNHLYRLINSRPHVKLVFPYLSHIVPYIEFNQIIMAKFFSKNNKGNLTTCLSPFNFKVNFIRQTHWTATKMMHFQDHS